MGIGPKIDRYISVHFRRSIKQVDPKYLNKRAKAIVR